MTNHALSSEVDSTTHAEFQSHKLGEIAYIMNLNLQLSPLVHNIWFPLIETFIIYQII